MAIDKLDDLLKLVNSSKATTVADLDDKLLGARVDNLRTSAMSAGSFDASTGVFTGKRGGPSDVTNLLEAHEGTLGTIKDLKSQNIPAAELEKVAEKQKGELTKKAQKVFGDLGESTTKHTAALGAITTEHAAIETKLSTTYSKELNALSKKMAAAPAAGRAAIQDEMTQLKTNYEAVREKLGTHVSGMKDMHNEHLSQVKTVAGDLEKASGLKATEHMGASATALTETAKTGKWFGKGGVISSNLKNSSTGMKFARGAGTLAGVVLVGSGIKDFGRLVGVVSPKLDDDGKELPRGAGTLFKGVAEVGLGAGALYLSLIKGGKGQGVGV